MTLRTTFGVVGIGSAAVAVAVAMGASPVAEQFPGGPGGGPGFGAREDMAVVAQFDADKNGRLDTAERKAAREFVESQGNAGRGGFGGRGGGRGGGGMVAGQPGPRVSPSSVAAVPATVPFYDPATVRTIFFEVDSDDWERELMVFKSTDVEIPAIMTVDGRKYPDVGLSFRGNSSFSMVPEGLKHSINVTVDFVHENQNVLGHRTLNLLNGNGDPSFLRGVLFQEIAQHYIPAARANYAQVVINGESWGVFSSIEQLNRDFFADRLKGDNGTRWKVPGSPGGSRAGLEYLGDDAESYRRAFEIKNKDNKKSWDALINLTRVLTSDTTPIEQLPAALAPILNVDGALRFLALDNVLVNSDGYWSRGSDYFLYLDESGRFHVLPNDTNETFATSGGPGGRGGRGRGPMGPGPGAPPPDGQGRGDFGGRGFGGPGGGGPTLDLLVGLTDSTKPLRSRLLAVPELRAKYLAYCREIATTWLDWKTLGPIATRYHTLITPLVERDTRKLSSTEAFASSLEGLRTFVEARRAYILAYEAR